MRFRTLKLWTVWEWKKCYMRILTVRSFETELLPVNAFDRKYGFLWQRWWWWWQLLPHNTSKPLLLACFPRGLNLIMCIPSIDPNSNFMRWVLWLFSLWAWGRGGTGWLINWLKNTEQRNGQSWDSNPDDTESTLTQVDISYHFMPPTGTTFYRSRHVTC